MCQKDGLTIRFSTDAPSIQHYPIEPDHSLMPRKPHEAYELRYSRKQGRVPLRFQNGAAIEAHIASVDYYQQAARNAVKSIEVALRLQRKLCILPFAPVSPEWVLTGGLPLKSGSAGQTSSLSNTVRTVSYTHLTLPTNREV